MFERGKTKYKAGGRRRIQQDLRKFEENYVARPCESFAEIMDTMSYLGEVREFRNHVSRRSVGLYRIRNLDQLFYWLV